MTQTIFMGLAAIQLTAMACFISATRLPQILFYQLASMVLALGLSVFTIGRLMGWPV